MQTRLRLLFLLLHSAYGNLFKLKPVITASMISFCLRNKNVFRLAEETLRPYFIFDNQFDIWNQ